MFFCNGKLKNENALFVMELKECTIIIKNVPTQICDKCGGKSYSLEVSEKIEEIIRTVEDSITEITVINYPGKVA